MISPGVSFDLIHVGKCAGATVARELRRGGYEFEKFHMRRPIVAPERRYVVTVRDPMARFVSAFNWRRQLLRSLLDPELRDADPVWVAKHRVEKAFIERFATAGSLAESLEPDPGFDVSPAISMLRVIAHVTEGFHWYLDELLDVIEPRQLLGVVSQENLDQDMQAMFGIRPVLVCHRGDCCDPVDLSALARRNLARVFSEEYRTLHRLERLADRAGVRMSASYSP